MTIKTDYNIDHEVIDGQYRVWWLGPSGYIHQQLFGSLDAAQRWVDEMRALETPA